MSIEALVTSSTAAMAAPGGSVAAQTDFSTTLARARDNSSSGPQAGGLLSPLLNLNTESTHLADSANRAASTDMRPSELMTLTVQSHEFLFHCQLVSNVANRSADGLQQLFRQQS